MDGKIRNVYSLYIKSAVLVILQEGGKITVQPMVARTKETLVRMLQKNISPDATVVTARLRSYEKLGDIYKHYVVNHNSNESVKDGFSPNDIECFWASFTKGITSVFHQLLDKSFA